MKMIIRSTLTLLFCLLFINPCLADVRIVAQQDAAEADSITLKINNKSHTRSLSVTGCNQCPLELEASYGVQYFFNNKKVDESKAMKFSGRPGTVIYNADKSLAISVSW